MSRRANPWNQRTGTALGLALLVLLATPALAQHHGSGGGGGCGDVFGDLIHIQRDTSTGQPILAKRWIEAPMDVYEWAYCPIAVDAAGEEIGFAELSCDPIDPEAVVETDYFGRLNGGRTKERNQRMHFDEVIETIKMACEVKLDETGRLKIKFCDGKSEPWSVVDSPMESMGLYVRLMKYGHLQTDPMEEDIWAHGDPATGPRHHTALGPEDWEKFHKSVEHLLPGWATKMPGDSAHCFSDDDGDGTWEVVEPFTDENGNGLHDPGEPYTDLDGDQEYDAESEGFDAACAAPESLTSEDFVRAGSWLAGAANKTGRITVDLVQYFNRIVRIAKQTQHTESTPDTLPALIRDCEVDGDVLPGLEPVYTDDCAIYPADSSYPAPADESFVDFSALDYERAAWREEQIEGVFPLEDFLWQELTKPAGQVVPLMGWLEAANGPVDGPGMGGFVGAASDALRAIEFVHNHAVPEDLWPEYTPVPPHQ